MLLGVVEGEAVGRAGEGLAREAQFNTHYLALNLVRAIVLRILKGLFSFKIKLKQSIGNLYNVRDTYQLESEGLHRVSRLKHTLPYYFNDEVNK